MQPSEMPILEAKIITVFGSSHPRAGEPDYEQARLLGSRLAARGFQVCTGGYSGVMEAASRGAKEAGGRTLAVTAKFFRSGTNVWVDEEYAVDTWQERLFELIRLGHGFVACKGGTGTLAELAVVWEMLNKGVMSGKPFVALGDFWTPILERVREVELGRSSRRGEAASRLIHVVSTPEEAADLFARALLNVDQTGAPTRQAQRPNARKVEAPVSRPAEQILEFDRLRDLLRAKTTSAPGGRAVDALAFGTDRSRLEREFAAIAEAVAYLRAGSELGFGGLADPQPWLERLDKPGAVLVPSELLDVASLIDTAAWLGEVFRDTAGKFPLLTERARSLADFRPLGTAIRRAILPNGEVSDDASAELRRIRGGLARARETIQKALERILQTRAARRPARTTSPAATIASSFPCALLNGAPCKAWFMPRARRARPFSSSRSKRSNSIIAWCSSPTKRPPRSRASWRS